MKRKFLILGSICVIICGGFLFTHEEKQDSRLKEIQVQLMELNNNYDQMNKSGVFLTQENADVENSSTEDTNDFNVEEYLKSIKLSFNNTNYIISSIEKNNDRFTYSFLSEEKSLEHFVEIPLNESCTYEEFLENVNYNLMLIGVRSAYENIYKETFNSENMAVSLSIIEKNPKLLVSIGIIENSPLKTKGVMTVDKDNLSIQFNFKCLEK